MKNNRIWIKLLCITMIIFLSMIICNVKSFAENNSEEKIVYLMCMACYTVYYFYEMYISLGYGANYHHFIQSIGIGL